MSSLAARIAPEVDRLVLGINRQVGPAHGRVLIAVARELGLDSLKLIPHLADFWLAGPLAARIAVARLPYAPEGTVPARIEELVSLGLLTETDRGHVATGRLRVLLAGAVAARSDIVARTWSGFEDTAQEADDLLRTLVDAFSDDHIVAAAHRDVRPDANVLEGFYHDLVTLRYVRQHDHVTAWRERGRSAPEMSVLTQLWRDESPGEDVGVLTSLEAAGLVEAGRLTDAGAAERKRIEELTDDRNGQTLSALGRAEGERLLELLESLPSSMS